MRTCLKLVENYAERKQNYFTRFLNDMMECLLLSIQILSTEGK